jgi:hypothetical protein
LRCRAAAGTSGRVFIFSISSALIALGFIGQVSQLGDAFYVFALTVLPTIYVLGCTSFVRLVECGAEDFRYGLAINRIRHYYKDVAGERADLFLLSAHDDGQGVYENRGLSAENRSPLFAFSTAVAVIDGVVAGATVTRWATCSTSRSLSRPRSVPRWRSRRSSCGYTMRPGCSNAEPTWNRCFRRRGAARVRGALHKGSPVEESLRESAR